MKRLPSVEMELDDLHSGKQDMGSTEYDKTKSVDVKTSEARAQTQARPIKEAWAQFMAQTSCHGMRSVGDPAAPVMVRVIYGLVIALMVISFHFTVIELAVNVLKYRVVTRTEIFVGQNLTFPTVTVCNMCPFSFRGKNESDPLYRLLAKQSMYGQMLPNVDPNESDSLQAFFNRTIGDLYDEYSMGLGLYLADYDGQEIDQHHFEPLNTIQGRCYQFNGPEYVSKHGPRRVTSTDRQSGLRVVLNIKQDDYGILDGANAGLRMYISHPTSVPPLETHGLQLMPGTSSLVAITTHQISFLPSPYKSYGSETCVDAAEDSPQLMSKMRSGRVYNVEICRAQCAAYKTSIKCACYMPGLVFAGLQECKVAEFAFGCYNNEYSRIMRHVEAECDCPRPCSLTFYDVQMSMSLMPSKVALKTSLKWFNETEESKIRENILETRVFFDSPLVKLMKHEPEYTIQTFLSSLGGQMGIYLGASMITVLEFLEMIVYTMHAAIRRLRRSR